MFSPLVDQGPLVEMLSADTAAGKGVMRTLMFVYLQRLPQKNYNSIRNVHGEW